MSYKTKVKIEDFSLKTRSFFQGRNIVVTGGSGFIGSHVVEQLLLLSPKKVTVPSRKEAPKFLVDIRDKINLQICDLRDFNKINQVMQNHDIVLDLSAIVTGIEHNVSHPASMFQENLEIFFNVIKAASKNKVKKFLVTSSACVYPRYCTIPTPESEGFKDEPEPTNSGYGWAKRMEEFLATKYSDEYSLPVAIARPYNAYGPRDNFHPAKSHVIPSLIKKSFDSQDGTVSVWGDGSQSRSFLHADDFARGLIETTAIAPNSNPINIGNHDQVTIKDLANIITKQISEIRQTKIIPQFKNTGPVGQPKRMCDTTRAQETIGFKAKITLEEGIKETIKWYIGNQHK